MKLHDAVKDSCATVTIGGGDKLHFAMRFTPEDLKGVFADLAAKATDRERGIMAEAVRTNRTLWMTGCRQNSIDSYFSFTAYGGDIGESLEAVDCKAGCLQHVQALEAMPAVHSWEPSPADINWAHMTIKMLKTGGKLITSWAFYQLDHENKIISLGGFNTLAPGAQEDHEKLGILFRAVGWDMEVGI